MSIFLYAWESTLNADIERRIRAMEMRCYRRLLGISYEDHTTNEEVSRRSENAIGPHVDLLSIVRQRKLVWAHYSLIWLCQDHHAGYPPTGALPCLHRYKKAFDRVWHEALWSTMRKYNINSNLIGVIENLYDAATSAVFCNKNIGDWFRTTVGVRQGCLLSPTLFNIFLERIMTDALEDHCGTSIGGISITNLRFADDIDGLAGNECEVASLVEQLDKASSNFGMEISAEKTKIMTNSKEPSKKETKINGQILESVTKFKYLGSIISDEGSKPEILSRIAQTTAALTKLKPIWNNKSIAISSMIRLLRSLVMSIFLYACESWTLNADIERRIRAMEMRCYRRLLGISKIIPQMRK
ncbi:endonuclease-reverse transcriptase [Plakobranchus ocellatus]|uniref:Endonuclease-reverse transcriptase n=1 Tax=Plakobranchus ocellatus TaxID=259542 RepID=A0AAV3Y9Q2_9GAST|nr:endonuclease-reverse transcriptase [Plakobranchus ocellatus]